MGARALSTAGTRAGGGAWPAASLHGAWHRARMLRAARGSPPAPACRDPPARGTPAVPGGRALGSSGPGAATSAPAGGAVCFRGALRTGQAGSSGQQLGADTLPRAQRRAAFMLQACARAAAMSLGSPHPHCAPLQGLSAVDSVSAFALPWTVLVLPLLSPLQPGGGCTPFAASCWAGLRGPFVSRLGVSFWIPANLFPHTGAGAPLSSNRQAGASGAARTHPWSVPQGWCRLGRGPWRGQLTSGLRAPGCCSLR